MQAIVAASKEESIAQSPCLLGFLGTNYPMKLPLDPRVFIVYNSRIPMLWAIFPCLLNRRPWENHASGAKKGGASSEICRQGILEVLRFITLGRQDAVILNLRRRTSERSVQ
jgi:hypothetical protein